MKGEVAGQPGGGGTHGTLRHLGFRKEDMHKLRMGALGPHSGWASPPPRLRPPGHLLLCLSPTRSLPLTHAVPASQLLLSMRAEQTV